MPKRKEPPNVAKSPKPKFKLVQDMFASLVVGGSCVFPTIKLTDEPVSKEPVYEDPIELRKLRQAAVLENK